MLFLTLLASSLDCLTIGVCILNTLVLALVLAPDDIGVPYPASVDNAGLGREPQRLLVMRRANTPVPLASPCDSYLTTG
jgi:hypothetical protein